jgi:hypothetical protein
VDKDGKILINGSSIFQMNGEMPGAKNINKSFRKKLDKLKQSQGNG